MINLTSMFDSYGRQARLYPGLLTMFPPLLTVIAWFPALITSSIGSTLLTIACSCGLLYALGVLSRTQGKKVEKRLLKKWGGWPTTIWLRHSSDYLDPQTRARYHHFLIAHVPGLLLPTAAAEAEDRLQADLAYASSVKWLQEQCRGKGFPLVEKENAEYGFRRNLRGMRTLGFTACLFAVALSLIGLVNGDAEIAALSPGPSFGEIWHAINGVSTTILAVVAINMFSLVSWAMLVTDQWVRDAGDQFARALLANCDRPAAIKATAASRSRKSKAQSVDP